MADTAVGRRTLPAWVRSRLDPDARYGLRVSLFALAVLLVGIPFGYLLEQVTTSGPLVRIDTSAAQALHGRVVHHPRVITLLQGISNLGWPPWFYVLVPAAVLFWVRRGRIRLAVYLVVTALVGGLIDTAVKMSVNRSRPEVTHPIATAHGKSFPSGHTMTATYVYGALLLTVLPLIPRRYRVGAIAGYALTVVAIAVSRLALGVHYLSDVIGGAVLGLAWLAASTAAFSIWRVEEGRKPVEVTDGLEPEVSSSRR